MIAAKRDRKHRFTLRRGIMPGRLTGIANEKWLICLFWPASSEIASENMAYLLRQAPKSGLLAEIASDFTGYFGETACFW
ncbi:MAG: hypothetical protein J7639_10890 [Paenibacillaceae bacterium]|nr:hypothetical protein [Paenibacillaceae bacterium]